MILELHFPLTEEETLLAAWETDNQEKFNLLKQKAENICNKYSTHFRFLHNETGNSLFIISSEKEDYESIQLILNKFCDQHEIDTLVF